MSRVTLPVSCNKDCGAGCPLIAHMEDGKITKISDNPLSGSHISGCARGYMSHEALYQPDRLLTPLVRIGERGGGNFKKVSWDHALDLIASNLKSCIEKHGPSGIIRLGGSGACRGALHNTTVLTSRFLGLLEGNNGKTKRFLDTTGNYSMQAMDFMTPLLVGTRPHGVDPQTLAFSKLIILWGANVEDTRFGAELCYRLREQKKRGTPVYVMDPRISRTAKKLGTNILHVFPGTDAAFMCAVLYELHRLDLIDRQFVDTYTKGFDVIMGFVLGKTDGVPKTPAWASAVCGTPEKDIRIFARVYGEAKPAALIPGLSLQRTLGGEEACRLSVALQAATGNIGIPGGSTGLSVWSALPKPTCGRMTVLHNPGEGPKIPVYLWADALLAGDARVIYNVGGNYIAQGSDVKKSIAAFLKADFIVTHEMFMTPTARYSDVVLPVASFLERRDILFPGMNWLLFSERAAAPLGDTKTDYDIFCELSGKLGFRHRFSEGRTEDDWLKVFLSMSEVADTEEFIKTGIYRGKNQERVGLADFRKDPVSRTLDTPSGKIELSSPSWAGLGLSPQPAILIPKPKKPYPLRMVTPHARYRINSQNFNSLRFDRLEPQLLWLHPEDAKDRGINDGDSVYVESPLGGLTVRSFVTENVMKGVVSLNQGAWPRFNSDAKGIEVSGAANVLTSTKPTMPSCGSRTHSVEVEVRKYNDFPRNLKGLFPPD